MVENAFLLVGSETSHQNEQVDSLRNRYFPNKFRESVEQTIGIESMDCSPPCLSPMLLDSSRLTVQLQENQPIDRCSTPQEGVPAGFLPSNHFNEWLYAYGFAVLAMLDMSCICARLLLMEKKYPPNLDV